MKFLLIVLVTRIIGQLIGTKQIGSETEEVALNDEIIYHPAETALR